MDEVVRKALQEQHRLKIGRYLGDGGFGEVYQAESAQGVPCAVKVSLRRLNSGEPGTQDHAVQRELDNLRLVQTIAGHPHVVTLIDYWLIGGYLVTRWELATEGSLADLLAQYVQAGRPGIPLDALLRYIYEAADGIDFLNAQRIYHRDIKPANLLLFQGQVKVADLGLAKFAGASTASHTGAGTLGYLPPEAYVQHRLSKTVDLYSLAATYVKLRTGKEPFGENPMEIIKRQEKGDPIVEGMESWEVELVRFALACDPATRFCEGAREWALALSHAYEAHLSGESDVGGILPSVPARLRSRRRWRRTRRPRKARRRVFEDSFSQLSYVRPILRSPKVPSWGHVILRVWDIDTGKCQRELYGHRAWVTAMAITPDGRRAVSGDTDGLVCVWDLQRGQRERTISLHPASCVAIATDGRRVVSGSSDGAVAVWDLETGECARTLQTSPGPHLGFDDGVRSLSLSLDGRRAVLVDAHGALKVWDLVSARCRRVSNPAYVRVDCAVITPDGRQVVACGKDRVLESYSAELLELEGSKYVRTIAEHAIPVRWMAFCPDGERLVSANIEGAISVWDITTPRLLHNLRGPGDAVEYLVITPDGRRLLAGGRRTPAHVWDLERGDYLHELRGHKDGALCMAIAPDGRRLVSSGFDCLVSVLADHQAAIQEELRSRRTSIGCAAVLMAMFTAALIGIFTLATTASGGPVTIGMRLAALAICCLVYGIPIWLFLKHGTAPKQADSAAHAQRQRLRR